MTACNSSFERNGKGQEEDSPKHAARSALPVINRGGIFSSLPSDALPLIDIVLGYTCIPAGKSSDSATVSSFF